MMLVSGREAPVNQNRELRLISTGSGSDRPKMQLDMPCIGTGER